MAGSRWYIRANKNMPSLFFATASADVEATITKCRQSLLLPPEVPGRAVTVRHEESKSLVSAPAATHLSDAQGRRERPAAVRCAYRMPACPEKGTDSARTGPLSFDFGPQVLQTTVYQVMHALWRR